LRGTGLADGALSLAARAPRAPRPASRPHAGNTSAKRVPRAGAALDVDAPAVLEHDLMDEGEAEPVPRSFVEKNGSKICPRCSAGCPGPSP
jgi:hypothetical protein